MKKPALNYRGRPRKSPKARARRDGRDDKEKTILQVSELRYRRLFESARDGILILDARKGNIVDVNPFLVEVLGRPVNELLGKQLWEIGIFQDAEKSKSAFRELQREGYIRYEDLPLETKDGRHVDVEFVSNVYRENGHEVIQCNIRDITERKHAEVERAILETVEKEQRRIGQDLHDGLCQQLTGVALIAEALAKKLSATAAGEAAEASEIAKLINLAITETRGLARGLAPVEIEASGLVSALYNLGAAMERRYKISCVFKCDEATRFERECGSLLSLHLYRIAQEAVNNAIQHGKARHVVISLTTADGRGILTIQDDGGGLPPNTASKPGMGIRGMRYRSRMINANFSIRKNVDRGTVVSCSFPSGNEQRQRKNEKKH